MMPLLLAAAAEPSHWLNFFLQQCVHGLSFGALIALVALGYTMVYGIIGLINFAHGDLFMLGSFLALTLIGWLKLEDAATAKVAAGIALLLVVVPLFCAALNWTVDRVVYRPLRNAPKLAPLVSAIGVSFMFMNIGQFWGGSADRNVPNLVSEKNLFGDRIAQAPAADANIAANPPEEGDSLKFTYKDLLLVAAVVPTMIGLTLLVKRTKLGRAMRATAQDPIAARLMGIPVERVIGATFLIGGALGGVASVVYSLYINTINFQMGYQNGLYAFTAAVLGGIGNIPGAVLGGLVIGLVRSLGSGYVSEHWVDAVIFGMLIVILVFRPTGLLGERTREKV
jgi:branched-chain amino acid transport system permease protein